MRILHICLANTFTDNYGYQENIMTKMHKLQGHDVRILASTETIVNHKQLSYVQPSEYINENGIKVCRLAYVKWLPHKIARKIRIFNGVYKYIEHFNPDIIFMHCAHTAAVYPITLYIQKHPQTTLYIDNHADFINSGRNWISKNVLHGIIYRKFFQRTIPYTKKYYGTLPIRVEVCTTFYGTPPEKTEFLPMGIDDTAIDFKNRATIRNSIRKKLGILDSDFVIITGGKINKRKNTHLLMQAFTQIKNTRLKLIVFGSITDEMKEEITGYLMSDNRIKYLNWIPANKTYNYFFASDLACFPGTHSTLWEDTVGYGIPAIFKKWDKIDHVNRNGNCLFLEEPTAKNIQILLEEIATEPNLYQQMLKCARSENAMKFFSFYNIAQKAIE